MAFDLDRDILALLIDAEAMSVVIRAGVRGYHFADDEIQEVVNKAVEHYVNYRQPLTREAVENWCPEFIEQRGWPEETLAPGEVIDQVMERYQINKTFDLLEEIAKDVREDPQKAISEGAMGLHRILQETTPRDRQVPWGATYGERQQAYLDEAAPDEPRQVIPLGWQAVTDFTLGIRPSELGVVCARIKIGKSWTLNKIALEAALAGRRVYLASMENSIALTNARIDCLLTGVPFRDYENGSLAPKQLEAMENGAEVAEAVGDRLLVDRPQRREERTVFELYSRAREHGADLFLGDQLTWVWLGGRQKDSLMMTELVMDLAQITNEFAMASLWAAQFNREVMHIKDQRGQLEHIGLSDQIGATVDWAFALTANKNMLDQHQRLFDIIKARRGPETSWVMQWELTQKTALEVVREYQGE